MVGPPQSWGAAAHSTALALLQPFITQEGVRASDPTGRGALGEEEAGEQTEGCQGRRGQIALIIGLNSWGKSVPCDT